MSAKPEIDPYYSLRDTVQEAVDRIQTNHKKFQSLLKTTDTSSNLEFKELRKGLRGDIRSVDEQLKFLKNAMDAIEKNRSNYSYIKDGELSGRKRFVEQSSTIVQNVKEYLESSEVRKKIEEDKSRSAHNPMLHQNDPKEEKLNRENERFLQGEQMKTRDLIQQQDRDLDKLNSALDTVHSQARLINDEVKTQNKMIDELDTEVNTASEKMNVVQAALSKLLRTKDSCQIWTIVILGLVLILLIALVIWT